MFRTPAFGAMVSEKWHPLLIKGLSSLADVQAGDSVWWHCDVIHSVAPVENQQGWGNVMYVVVNNSRTQD
nr:YbiU family protein [Pseudomonas fuscovaginae]